MLLQIKTFVLFFIGIFYLSSATANNEFCAVGDIEGSVCKGIFIKSCKFVKVDAVKGNNDKLFTINECYQKVSNFDERKGRCWINTKVRGDNLIFSAVNSAFQPEFFHKNKKGNYEELDVDYITFQCVKK